MLMRRVFWLAAVCGLLAFPGGAARADWNLGDPHKMHYPQLPRLYESMDINASFPKILADDWRCRETGLVSDIHIWGSWDHDEKFTGAWIHASIHEYLPPGTGGIPWSRPGQTLWQHDFQPGRYTQREWVETAFPPPYPQYFWDPKEPFQPTINHLRIWQYNMENIENAFVQQQGELYFLNISFFAGYDALGKPISLPSPFRFGWKESRSPHFNDDGVWGHYGPGPYPGPPWWQPGMPKPVWPSPDPWNELRHPVTQESIDLAFVITPEPATLALLVVAGLAVSLKRKTR